MTYGEATQRATDLRAIGRKPVATYHARHIATAHAERIGGEVLPGPFGLDVFAPELAPTPERHETVALFTPAPAVMPGQESMALDAVPYAHSHPGGHGARLT